MKKTTLILILFLIFTLPSCAEGDRPSCREILGQLMTAEIGLPAGKVYSMTASQGEDEYLPEHLINALYGGGERPVMADGWLDLALFLPSSQHPYELAVFLCDSEDTATDTARMLCRRLDIIRTTKSEGDYSSYFDNATVTVMRNYVLFIISSDTQNALKIASRKIG